MEIRNLLTFMKVAEEQSLSKAAAVLGYAQSTVTMQMQQLEQELGTSLYERVGRQIRITEKGQELLSYAAQIVSISQEAMQIAKQTDRKVVGELRIGMSDEIDRTAFTNTLIQYHKQFPDVKIIQKSGNAGDLTELLLHNEIDFMMVLDHHMNDSIYDVVCEREEKLHLVAACGYKQRKSVKEILQGPVIHLGNESVIEKELQSLYDEQMIKPDIELRITDIMLAVNTVLLGDAAVLLPDSLTAFYIRQGSLKVLEYEIGGGRIWSQTVCHKNKWKTDAMKAWIDLANGNHGVIEGGDTNDK